MSEKDMYILDVNPRFKDIIPRLSNKAFKKLKASLKADGIRDAIVVWNNTILDGHKRYDLAQRHNLKFSIERKEFDSEDKAFVWVVENQLKRDDLPHMTKLNLCAAWLDTVNPKDFKELYAEIKKTKKPREAYIASIGGFKGTNKVQNHRTILRYIKGEQLQQYLSEKLSLDAALEQARLIMKTDETAIKSQKESNSPKVVVLTKKENKALSPDCTVAELKQMLIEQFDTYVYVEDETYYTISCSETELKKLLEHPNLSDIDRLIIGLCLYDLYNTENGVESVISSQVKVAELAGLNRVALMRFMLVMRRATVEERQLVLCGKLKFSSVYNKLPKSKDRSKTTATKTKESGNTKTQRRLQEHITKMAEVREETAVGKSIDIIEFFDILLENRLFPEVTAVYEDLSDIARIKFREQILERIEKLRQFYLTLATSR